MHEAKSGIHQEQLNDVGPLRLVVDCGIWSPPLGGAWLTEPTQIRIYRRCLLAVKAYRICASFSYRVLVLDGLEMV